MGAAMDIGPFSWTRSGMVVLATDTIILQRKQTYMESWDAYCVIDVIIAERGVIYNVKA